MGQNQSSNSETSLNWNNNTLIDSDTLNMNNTDTLNWNDTNLISDSESYSDTESDYESESESISDNLNNTFNPYFTNDDSSSTSDSYISFIEQNLDKNINLYSETSIDNISTNKSKFSQKYNFNDDETSMNNMSQLNNVKLSETSNIIDSTTSDNLIDQLNNVQLSETSNKSESISEFNNIFKGGGGLKDIKFVDSSSSDSEINFSDIHNTTQSNTNSNKYDFEKSTSDNTFSLKGLNTNSNSSSSSNSEYGSDDSEDLKISYSLSSFNVKNDNNYGKLFPKKEIIDRENNEYDLSDDESNDDNIYSLNDELEKDDDEYGKLSYNINFEDSQSEVSTFNTSDIEVVSVNSGKRFL